MEKPAGPPHRVLLIGWDGATFHMIDPLVAAGRLPNLARMLDEGVNLELESTIIPISAAAWAAAVTGKGPAKTGIFSFYRPVPDSYQIRLISSRDRRVPAVWHFLNHYGLRTHVVGVPVTYPPEPIDGVMIAGMLSPFGAEYTHPPELADTLRSQGFVPDLDVWREVQPVRQQVVEQQHDLKVRITTDLLEDSDWDFAMIVFKCLDVLKHRWHTGLTRGPIAEHYERLDAALGELRESAGPNTDVLVMSDHGFGVYTSLLSVQGCLVELGLAALNPQESRVTADLNVPLAESIPAIHSDEVRRLDMSKTLVFCDSNSTEGNFAALRLNLEGREPAGCVAPERREAVIDEVIARLLSLRQAPDGPPVFTRVIRLTDLYQGPHTEGLPDILLETDRKFMCKPWYRQPFMSPLQLPWPEHELVGVLVAAGPSFRTSQQRGYASILDITPTVLQLFSLPVSNQMDGRVLTETLRGEVRVVSLDEPELGGAADAAGTYQAEEAQQIYERLKSLGYIGDAPDEDSDGRHGDR